MDSSKTAIKMAEKTFEDAVMQTFYPEPTDFSNPFTQSSPATPPSIYVQRPTTRAGIREMTVDDAKILFNGHFGVDVPAREEQNVITDLDVISDMHTAVPVMLCQWSIGFINNYNSCMLKNNMALLMNEKDVDLFITSGNMLSIIIKDYLRQEKYRTSNGNLKFNLAISLYRHGYDADLPKDLLHAWRMNYYEDMAANNRLVHARDESAEHPSNVIERHKVKFYDMRCGALYIWPNPIAMVDHLVGAEKLFIAMKLTHESHHAKTGAIKREYTIPLRIKAINSNAFINSKGTLNDYTKSNPDSLYFCPADNWNAELAFRVCGIKDTVRMTFYVWFNDRLKTIEDGFEHDLKHLMSGVSQVNVMRQRLLTKMEADDSWAAFSNLTTLKQQIADSGFSCLTKTIGSASILTVETEHFDRHWTPFSVPILWNRLTYLQPKTVSMQFDSAAVALDMDSLRNLTDESSAYSRLGGFDSPNYYAILSGKLYFDAMTEIQTLLMRIYNEKVISRMRELYDKAERAVAVLQNCQRLSDISRMLPNMMYSELLKTEAPTNDAQFQTALMDLALFTDLVLKPSSMYYDESYLAAFPISVSEKYLARCHDRYSSIYADYRARKSFYRKQAILKEAIVSVKAIIQQRSVKNDNYPFEVLLMQPHGYFMPAFLKQVFMTNSVEISPDQMLMQNLINVLDQNRRQKFIQMNFSTTSSSSSSSSSSDSDNGQKVITCAITDELMAKFN